MTKNLNVKQMKETLVNFSGDQSEMTKVWKTFWRMHNMGFISNEDWCRFFNETSGWYVTEDGAEVRNADDDSLIYRYTPHYSYRADDLTYKQFMELAQKNYYKGGDGYVECWDEKSFTTYIDAFGGITKARALAMFKLDLELEREQEELRRNGY